MSYVSNLFGCDYYTLRLGMEELDDEAAMSMRGIRRQGGGRKSAISTLEGLETVFLRLLAQHTAGSPMDETMKWTNLTRQEIAELLQGEGIEVSATVVDQLLERHYYRRRKAQNRLSIGTHPKRNEQFENIEQLIETYQAAGNPVISMDTKKKK